MFKTKSNDKNNNLIPKLFLILLLLFLSLALLPFATDEIDETLPTTDNQEIFLSSTHDTSAVLLLHGLTATPWELKELAYFLNDNNLTVSVPIIAGHSTSLSNLEKTTWEDWFNSASNAFDKLKEDYDNIFVLGVSNGALLAIDLAAEKELKPKGIISVAAPFKFTNPIGELTLIGKYFQRYSDHSVEGDEIGHYYSVIPTKVVAEIIIMRKSVDKHLPTIHTPILIIHSEQDPTAHPNSAQYLYNNIASEQKAIILRTEEEHVLISNKKTDLYQDILEFIELNS